MKKCSSSREDNGPDDAIDDLAAELVSVVAQRPEADATAKEQALGIFKINKAANLNKMTSYTVTILKSKVKLFSLVIRYVSLSRIV